MTLLTENIKGQKVKFELKEEDWDNQIACKEEAVRLGITAKMGYYAWFVGQGAGGYESVLDFFKDVLECYYKRESVDGCGKQYLVDGEEYVMCGDFYKNSKQKHICHECTFLTEKSRGKKQ